MMEFFHWNIFPSKPRAINVNTFPNYSFALYKALASGCSPFTGSALERSSGRRAGAGL